MWSGRNGDAPVKQDAEVRAIVCARSQDQLVDAMLGADFDAVTRATLADVLISTAHDESFLLLLDAHESEWLREISDLMQARPNARVVMLHEPDGPEEFIAAVTAGVAGFCSADASVEAVLRTLHSVRSTGIAIPRAMVVPLVEHVRHSRGRTVQTAGGSVEVTDREFDVLQLLLQRRTTREMAGSLFVSEGTVRGHISVVLRKIGAVDREDAIALIERGRRV